ncbi:MAG: GNAT family N-acetyltransferase [Actinomycetota bacterium]
MGRCPTIETERLILRPFREDDLDAYTAVMQSSEVRRWLFLPDDVGREHAWQSMVGMLGQWELRNTGNWALEAKATGEFVGRAGSYFPERANWPGIEIGWTLHPAHVGKGYATEAGAAARDWVFANHDVDAIHSCILFDNLASQAVAKRLGFEFWEERTFPHFPRAPHGIWRLLRADWAHVDT